VTQCAVFNVAARTLRTKDFVAIVVRHWQLFVRNAGQQFHRANGSVAIAEPRLPLLRQKYHLCRQLRHRRVLNGGI
jgi:hypothetical protein